MLRREAFCFLVLLSLRISSTSQVIGTSIQQSSTSTRSRPSCLSSESPPPTQVNTTAILEQLRGELITNVIHAYVITSSNDHQGEYIPAHDKRVRYVSGFTGSSSDAVVTRTKAVLWTDSRYYLQAENQLDCNWDIMKTGEKGTPTIIEWLATELGSGETIAADSKIITHRQWSEWENHLKEINSDLLLDSTLENLVDNIWTVETGRPPYVTDGIFVLDVLHAGETWQKKLERVRSAMTDLSCDAFVVTALDEIAWFLNLRGTDIPYSPFFRAYLIIEATSARVYLPIEKQTSNVAEHLNAAGSDPLQRISISGYESIWVDLPELATRTTKILLPDRLSYALGVSQRIYSLLPPEKVKIEVSPILRIRDSKNDVEAQGMRKAHIRDAVALCKFLHLIETDLANGGKWDELKAVTTLDGFRAEQQYNQGPSFGTISAFGINSALPHYSPTDVTNLVIDGTSLYMLDSGGQYLDGTTDVTRTMHYGEPTDLQREAYTRLLIGCIALASVTFPEGKTVSNLEILVRAPLYGLGLDYGHGSTHGIGFYGGVHEAFDSTYHINFFGSQEPGYYLADNYGMRLENIATVVEANLPLSDNTTFLKFEIVTLVPYDRKLIKEEMLNAREITWLNEYYNRIRQDVGSEMLKQNLQDAHNWLIEKTVPFGTSSASGVAGGKALLLVLVTILTIGSVI